MAEQSYNLKYTGKEIDDLLDKANDMNSSAQVPVGGTSGQVLTKKSGTDYDAEWKTPEAPSNPLPVGGTTGQVLAKSSNTDFDVTWTDQTGGGGISGDSNVVIAVYENNTLSKTYDELLAAINDNKIVCVIAPGNTYTRCYSYQYTRDDYGLVFTAPPKTFISHWSIRTPFFAVKSDNTITENISFVAGAVPSGGTTGQILRKKTSDNYATEWVDTDVNLIASANAGAHNATYRGKFLGNRVTEEQYAAISAGTFDDLYIGDYWTIGGVNYRIAAFDYYLNSGDTSCTTHHVVIVPDTCLYNAAMNSTNTTAGGYVGSKMYTTGLADAKTTINNAFGSSNILTHRQYLCNAVNNGKPSGGSWYDSTVELMTEQNVFGGKVFGVSNDGSTVPSLYTVDKSQYPLFAFRPDLISNENWFWLRDVVSSPLFAYVSGEGFAGYSGASASRGVRPAFSIKA